MPLSHCCGCAMRFGNWVINVCMYYDLGNDLYGSEFVVDLTFLDFLDDVGLASIYAREALSNSSFSTFMRPPRAGMHTNSSASTS